MAKRWPVWVRFNRITTAWEILSVDGTQREFGADDEALAVFRTRGEAVIEANAMNERYKSVEVLGRPPNTDEPPKPTRVVVAP